MICQFCGKQVDDNAGICRYCGSKLVPTSKAAEPVNTAAGSNDMTIAMPKVKKSASALKGFESSRAVCETENKRQDSAASSGVSYESLRQNYSSKAAPKRASNQKRQYYRYNPDAKQTRRRTNNNSRIADRKAAPRYNGYANQPPRARKHAVLRWIGKTLLLAVIGIIIGIIIYLATVNVTNWFKSMGDRGGSSSSVTETAPESKTNSVNNESSSKQKEAEKSESKNSDTNSTTEKKNSSSDGSEGSGTEKKNNTTDESSSETKKNNDEEVGSSNRDSESASDNTSNKNNSETSGGSSAEESKSDEGGSGTQESSSQSDGGESLED